MPQFDKFFGSIEGLMNCSKMPHCKNYLVKITKYFALVTKLFCNYCRTKTFCDGYTIVRQNIFYYCHKTYFVIVTKYFVMFTKIVCKGHKWIFCGSQKGFCEFHQLSFVFFPTNRHFVQQQAYTSLVDAPGPCSMVIVG